MAAGGARAAGRADAPRRRANATAADDAEVQARLAAFVQGCSNWAGPRPQRADRHSLGCGRCRPTFASMRRNWSRSRRTSSWPLAPAWPIAAGDPHRADRVRWSSPIRSAPASSTAWRGRAAMSPVLSRSNTAMSGKWLELLKEIAPGVTRAAVIRDPAITAGIGQFAAIQSVAPSLGVELSRSTCATPARSSAPSRPSRAPRTAA